MKCPVCQSKKVWTTIDPVHLANFGNPRPDACHVCGRCQSFWRIEPFEPPPAPAPISEEYAQFMLAQLAHHYKEPVRKVSDYCEALEDWMHAIEQLHVPEVQGLRQGASYVEHLQKIRIDIRKSSFLWRRIYDGEALRTIRCDGCNGSWAAHGFFADPDVWDYGEEGCGCHGSGWLHTDSPVVCPECHQHQRTLTIDGRTLVSVGPTCQACDRSPA